MGDAFVSQPEFFETDIGESLLARTETLATFRELGPPDLCQVVKTTDPSGKSSAKDVRPAQARATPAPRVRTDFSGRLDPITTCRAWTRRHQQHWRPTSTRSITS